MASGSSLVEDEFEEVLPVGHPHVEALKQNLMMLKNHLVHCNTMMVDEFTTFGKLSRAGNKSKSFWYVEKKKEP